MCVCVCGGGGGGGRVTYMSLVPSDVIPTDLTNTGRDQSRNHHEHRAATGGAVPPTDQVSGLPTENAMFVCVCVLCVCVLCVVCVCGLFLGEGEVCVWCVGGGGGGVGDLHGSFRCQRI